MYYNVPSNEQEVSIPSSVLGTGKTSSQRMDFIVVTTCSPRKPSPSKAPATAVLAAMLVELHLVWEVPIYSVEVGSTVWVSLVVAFSEGKGRTYVLILVLLTTNEEKTAGSGMGMFRL